MWDVHFQSAVDINEAGDWVAPAIPDDGLSETQCIVKNGEVLYRDGHVLDDIAPFALNGYYPGRYLKLTDEGDVIWFGSCGDGGLPQSGLFFDDSLVLGRGAALGMEVFGRWINKGLPLDGSRLGAAVTVEAPTFTGFEVLQDLRHLPTEGSRHGERTRTFCIEAHHVAVPKEVPCSRCVLHRELPVVIGGTRGSARTQGRRSMVMARRADQPGRHSKPNRSLVCGGSA